MRTGNCENCGEKMYNYLCVNCHEANYIEDQYHELNMEVPDSIYVPARKNEQEAERRKNEYSRSSSLRSNA